MNSGEFIKGVRAYLGISQVKLSQILKVNQSSISYWENGTKQISGKSIKKLKKFCDLKNIRMDLEDFL